MNSLRVGKTFCFHEFTEMKFVYWRPVGPQDIKTFID